MQKALDDQKKLSRGLDTPYVFINTQGRPILQDKLREHWPRAMKKSGLKYRRIYECRHTFAFWALGAGELPEWVARTLGHVDTSMIYKTYGRYIRNLLRTNGSAFESLVAKKGGGSRTISGSYNPKALRESTECFPKDSYINTLYLKLFEMLAGGFYLNPRFH